MLQVLLLLWLGMPQTTVISEVLDRKQVYFNYTHTKIFSFGNIHSVNYFGVMSEVSRD